MASVRDLIKGSLRLIGASDPGEALSAEEAADGLITLNELLESLSADGLLVHEYKREKFDLVPAQSSYTFGTGGNFNSARPIKIEMAALEIQTDVPYETPIEILNDQQWAGVISKNLTSEIPTKIFIANTFPLETIYIYPVPSVAHKIVFYSQKPLTAYTSVSDSVSLPIGYYKLLRYSLALAFAPEYGKEPSALVLQEAERAKDDVRRLNFRPVLMSAEKASKFNILSGDE